LCRLLGEPSHGDDAVAMEAWTPRDHGHGAMVTGQTIVVHGGHQLL
jgi:hypothetical protein